MAWLANLDKAYFTGKRVLLREQGNPISRQLVKLSVEGNKPPTDSFLYDGKNGKRIGTIRSNIWLPILKANLTMADIEYKHGRAPKEIWTEIYYQKELEWQATWAKCAISEQPF